MTDDERRRYYLSHSAELYAVIRRKYGSIPAEVMPDAR